MIKKGKAIVKAFTNELPVEESWYKARLEACSSCSLNSENVVDKSFLQTLREGLDICPEVRYCTACKCCIDRKAAVKTEECGIRDKKGLENEKLLWESIESQDQVNKGVSVTNLSSDKILLKYKENKYYFDAGETTDKVVDVKFQVFIPNTYKYTSAVAGCSCTVADVVVISENIVEFNVKVSTLNFRVDIQTEKNISLYFTQGNLQRVLNIKIQATKK